MPRLSIWIALLLPTLIVIAARGDERPHPVVPAFERFAGKSPAEQVRAGQVLIGELGCTACHASDTQTRHWLVAKKAPVLTEVALRVRPSHLRALVADPHRTKPGTMMPQVLGKLSEAERTAQADALVHYLVSLAGGGTLDEQMPDRTAAKRGEKLFHEVGCVACHDARTRGAKPLAASVPLGDLAAKYTIGSLAAFLRNPLKVRPSGRMPDPKLNDQEARDLAHYFLQDVQVSPNLAYRVYEGSWDQLPDFEKLKPVAEGQVAGFDIAVAGRESNYGLRFTGYVRIATEGRHKFHLSSDDGSRLVIDDQVIVDRDGVHPPGFATETVHLSAGVHRVTLDYFQAGGGAELVVEYEGKGVERQGLASAMTLTAEGPRPSRDALVVNPRLAAEGRAAFVARGCAACHEVREDKTLVASTLVAPPLRLLKPTGGCLDAPPSAKLPQFALSDAQRTAIAAAIAARGQFAQPLAEAEQIHRTLLAFNCYACHVRGGVGGVEPQRNERFATTVKEMGDEGRIPPPLDGVGSKLTTAWLKELLDRGADDRDYMLTRMPRFGGSNVGHLVELFAKADPVVPLPAIAFSEPEHEVKAQGRFLAGGKAFSCIKCHNFGKLASEGVPGINMTGMTRRLRPEWFQRYVRDPQAARPGTRMPSAWPKKGPSMLPKILGGDSDVQIAAVWAYLGDGDKAAPPYGVGRQPLPLVPLAEPIVYRNFIEGAGPRAIGVGYPEHVDLAFDANDCRLALAWQGDFIDASLHWTGRGSGFQSPLGDLIVRLPVGVPLATLEKSDSPWPTTPAKEQGYQFLGYRLDAARRPEFMYRSKLLQIGDLPEPVPNPAGRPGLRRTLTLTPLGPTPAATFRAVVANKIEPEADGWYKIDGRWRLRLEAAGASPVVRRQAGTAELVLPLAAGFQGKIVETFEW